MKHKQNQNCSPGLVVQPQLGKAVLWYNHKIDRGHLGPLNIRSTHSGCNVNVGSKWVANHWFGALPHPDLPFEPATSHYRIDAFDP
eukprot:m.416649 g.416649  ORF g.416649 m.416649 type:complete len:86 (-) comp56614_c0_seq3:153-410(-)